MERDIRNKFTNGNDKIVVDFVKSLGFDPLKLKSIQIHIEANKPVKIITENYASDERFSATMEEYNFKLSKIEKDGK